MDHIQLDSSLSPHILIQKISGNLRIKGWDRTGIRADANKNDTLSIENENDSFTVECDSGCILRVPVDSSLQIGTVDGELMLKSLENQIEVETVNGQILAKSVGPMKIGKAKGNINIKYVEGDFSCEVVQGIANIQDVEGSITVKENDGNLTIKGFSSEISATTKGNASLRLDPKLGGEFVIKADGNISCRLEPDVSAEIHLISGAENIKVEAFGTSDRINAKEHEFDIGDGDSKITLEAAGNVDLSALLDSESDWGFNFEIGEDMSSIADDISQVVTEQIEQQMDSLARHINELTSKFPDSSVEERTRKNLEAKRRKLERKLEHAERRVAQKVRDKARQTAASARRYSYRREPASDPVTDQERQKVLEMLQNQQISVNEAEILLAALEGNTPKSDE